jgi:pyruvate ferredoxin oxidoreductase beta subunit/2-oxoisovalerate ferredoxin oxidoreductase beta subunit
MGSRYTVNREPTFRDVSEYLNLQGRFRHLTPEQVDAIRRNIASDWRRLRGRTSATSSTEDN